MQAERQLEGQEQVHRPEEVVGSALQVVRKSRKGGSEVGGMGRSSSLALDVALTQRRSAVRIRPGPPILLSESSSSGTPTLGGMPSKYLTLLDDDDVRRWYGNLAAMSAVTAGMYLREAKGKKFRDESTDFVRRLEKEGRAGRARRRPHSPRREGEPQQGPSPVLHFRPPGGPCVRGGAP